MRVIILSGIVAFLCIGDLTGSSLSAQSFRDRVLGSTLTKRAKPGAAASAAEGAGTLTGTERFLRSNRAGGSFVGAAPVLEGFIGAVQAAQGAAPVQNNINANRAQVAPTLLNPPRSPARKVGPYEPRLVLESRPGSTTNRPDVSSEGLRELIRQVDSSERFGRVQVRLSDRTALLTGEVADSHDRELLSNLLKLEPGVEDVQNDLVVGLPPSPKDSP